MTLIYTYADTAIQVGDVSNTSSQSVRNLGIMLDQTLSMKQHITHVCHSVYISSICIYVHCSAISLLLLLYTQVYDFCTLLLNKYLSM